MSSKQWTGHVGLLDEFFRLEESLQMLHLPNSHSDKQKELTHGPVEHTGVRRLGRLPETFLAISLVVLLLGDLFCLRKQLPHSDLQIGEFLLLRHRRVVDSVLTHLQIQVDSQLAAGEPLRRVWVQTDGMLAGWVWCECEAAFRRVDLWKCKNKNICSNVLFVSKITIICICLLLVLHKRRTWWLLNSEISWHVTYLHPHLFILWNTGEAPQIQMYIRLLSLN